MPATTGSPLSPPVGSPTMQACLQTNNQDETRPLCRRPKSEGRSGRCGLVQTALVLWRRPARTLTAGSAAPLRAGTPCRAVSDPPATQRPLTFRPRTPPPPATVPIAPRTVQPLTTFLFAEPHGRLVRTDFPRDSVAPRPITRCPGKDMPVVPRHKQECSRCPACPRSRKRSLSRSR